MRHQPKKATLKDVAREAGFAPTTVSGVLRGNKGTWASKETRRKIFAAARKINYKRNQNALSLRLNRSFSIIIIVPDITNQFFSYLIRELQLNLRSSGYECILEESQFDKNLELKKLDDALNRNVDGTIAMTLHDHSIERLLDFRKNGVPLLHIGSLPDGINIDCITVGTKKSSDAAIQKLKLYGHKKIGFVDSLDSLNDPVFRLQTYIASCKRNGLLTKEEWILTCPSEMLAIKKRVSSWFSNNKAKIEMPTALLCTEDITAIATISALQDLGLRIPQDISVVGFNNIPLCEFINPKLSTINQPIKEIALESSKIICDRINSGYNSTVKKVNLETTFVSRDSIGPCSQ